MGYSFNSLQPDYERDLTKAELTRTQDVVRQARHLISIMGRYEHVAASCGVPASWLAAIDYRESGNNPATYMGNGERIIGHNTKTKLVPAGRGPFTDWNSGAIDSLAYMGISHSLQTWTLLYAAYEAERWNGFGYRFHGIADPYLWAGTNLYTVGKFDSDGHFSKAAKDAQLGVIPLLQMIGQIESTLALAT
jgi:lysozyme family protein